MLVAAIFAVGAAVFSLLTERLERMAVATAVIGLVAAFVAASAAAWPAAAILIGAGAISMAVCLAAVVVIEVDARPSRTPRAWKLLLLVPLGVAAGLGFSVAPPEVATTGASAAQEAVPLVALALGAVALAVPLIARRRQHTSEIP